MRAALVRIFRMRQVRVANTRFIKGSDPSGGLGLHRSQFGISPERAKEVIVPKID
jgi:hypothetical protein